MSTAANRLVQAELPASVRLESGEGDLPRLRVASSAAHAEVYLHGAHVTSWTPTGDAPVLWTSAASAFTAGAPIRGGVPICFPWFGAHAEDPQAPAHGFARLADWTLVDAADGGHATSLAFRLTDADVAPGPAWPHRFEVIYRVSVGARLVLRLEVSNLDTAEVAFEEALHTYYAVRDVREVAITGLEDAAYLDRLGGAQPMPPSAEPIRIGAETDRIYLDTAAAVTIEDPGLGRAVTVRKEGSRSTVVWNPGVDKARAMSDFGDDEWPELVCVETCNVRDAAVRLEAGGTHVMTAVVEVKPDVT